MLVYPDGRYRLEKSFQNTSDRSIYGKVYLDTLPEPKINELQANLDDDKLQKINTGPLRSGGIIRDMDPFIVSIPREHEVQNIAFMNDTERRPFDKELKPLQAWLKETQKRKVPVDKNEKTNNCAAPRVMYRGASPAEAEAETPSKQP
jgi:hypothetical protein